MTKTKGKFITLEGIDGAGKTTLVSELGNILSLNGVPHITVETAKGTEFAKQLVKLIIETEAKETLGSHVSALLFMAAKRQVYDTVIKPALDKGIWVICDRFYDSSLAYHGFAVNNESFIEAFPNLKEFCFDHRHPDITFVLDIPVAVSASRLKKRGDLNIYDQKDDVYKNNMRQGYLQMVKHEPERFKVINADRKLHDIVQEIMTHLICRNDKSKRNNDFLNHDITQEIIPHLICRNDKLKRNDNFLNFERV